MAWKPTLTITPVTTVVELESWHLSDDAGAGRATVTQWQARPPLSRQRSGELRNTAYLRCYQCRRTPILAQVFPVLIPEALTLPYSPSKVCGQDERHEEQRAEAITKRISLRGVWLWY
jgi:hypothetical protein